MIVKKLNFLLNILIFTIIFGIVETAFALPPILVQEHYRWRNDDGSEVTATWKAPADTKAYAVTNKNIRLRFAVKNTAFSGDSSLRLQYCVGSTNGPWTTITTNANNEFVMSETSNYVNYSTTTDLLQGSGDFVATGRCIEAPSNVVLFAINSNEYANLEFCFQATTNCEWNSTNFFKLLSIPAIDNYPELIIGVPEPAFIIFMLSIFCFLKFKIN